MSKLLVDEISDADNTGPVTVTDGAVVNRTGDGTIVNLQVGGTSVGSIGGQGGELILRSTGSAYSVENATRGFVFNNTNLRPYLSADAAIDLGQSNGRFKDLYLSGGVRSTGSLDITIPETVGAAINMEFGNAANDTRRTVMFYKDAVWPAVADTAAINLGGPSNKFKDLYLSGGVNFGDAGGTGTSTSNSLDSYEEGTWVPTLPYGGTVTSTAGSVYTKVGNLVHYQMYMQMNSIPNNGTGFSIGGLPFAAATSGGKQLHGNSVITYLNNVNGSDFGSGLNDTGASIYWHNKANGGLLTNGSFTGVTQLILAGFYPTAS